MSDIQIYLLEAEKNKAEARRIAEQSANKLLTKQLKLIDLITSLEEYINNKDDATQRFRSLAYLADVLENVQPRVLSGQERRLLCDFVLGRLEGDVEGVGASARALLALEKLGKWDAATVQRVMQTLMSHVHPLRQFKLQTERYPVIQLVDMLLANYRRVLLDLHEADREFMTNFVSFFEGEKDPRNLMIIFSLLQVPMAEWDIQANAQDMFEAVFNYFPITFKPPPDDPYGITAQDLKDRLRDCISANSDFAPYSFPALLDKLDSTSMNTKRDVLLAMQACVERYGAQTINLYSVTLWDALKFEVLNVQEEDLATEALKTLKLLAGKFVDAGIEGPLLAYLRPIIKECNEHLEDAPTKQSLAAGRILHSVASASPIVADKLVKGVLPTLFTLYDSTNSIAKRRGLLEVLNQITGTFTGFQAAGVETRPEALEAFAEESTTAMLRAMTHAPKSEVSFRLTAMTGLVQLVGIRGVLSETQINTIVDVITTIIIRERVIGHGDIRNEAIKALTELAHSTPESIRAKAIPAFMVELPDVPDNMSRCEPILEAFAQLSTEQQIFDTIVLRLKNKLSAARFQNAPRPYQHTLLLALLYAFTFGSPVQEDGTLRSSYLTDYAEPLLVHFRDALPSERDEVTANTVGRVLNVILRTQTTHFQSTTHYKTLAWLPQLLTDPASGSEALKAFAPISLYYYAALRSDIPEPAEINALLRLYAVHVTNEVPSSATGALIQHISLLVNKFLDHKNTKAPLEEAQINIEAILSSGTASPAAIRAVFAVVKALIIQGKNGSLTSQYLKLLLEHLPKADRTFAQQFETLLATDEILTKENHCTVSGLYKQKTFNVIVPSIVEALKTADQDVKFKYLIALSGILKWLPYSLLESSLPSLVSPLLQSLDLSGPSSQSVKTSALTIFESLLMHNPTIVEEHSASLITRLLHATSGPQNAASVRAKALQCLTLVPRQIKREAVVPYRQPVVKKLLACLDDVKRAVRAEAVKCRSAWLVLEEGNEDEE